MLISWTYSVELCLISVMVCNFEDWGCIIEHTNYEGGYVYQYSNLLLLSNRKLTLYGKGIAKTAAVGGASVYPGGVGRR